MKRTILLSLGFFPLLLFGYYLNHLVVTVFADIVAPYFAIGVVIVIIWLILGMVSAKLFKSDIDVARYLNAPAFIILLLIFVQEFVIRAFWSNPFGALTQNFYLPLIRFGTAVWNTVTLPLQLLNVYIITRMSYVAATAFICLYIASCIGIRIVKKGRKY